MTSSLEEYRPFTARRNVQLTRPGGTTKTTSLMAGFMLTGNPGDQGFLQLTEALQTIQGDGLGQVPGLLRSFQLLEPLEFYSHWCSAEQGDRQSTLSSLELHWKKI